MFDYHIKIAKAELLGPDPLISMEVYRHKTGATENFLKNSLILKIGLMWDLNGTEILHRLSKQR